MQYLLKTGDPCKFRTPCLVLGIFANRKLSETAVLVNSSSSDFLRQVLKKGDMGGKSGQSMMLYDVPGVQSSRLLLIGLGAKNNYDRSAYCKATAAAASVLNSNNVAEATFCLPLVKHPKPSLPQTLKDTVISIEQTLYLFQQCKSKAELAERQLKKLLLYVDERRIPKSAQQAVDQGMAIASGTVLAKDLGNLPGNICTPEYLASQAKTLSRKSRKLKVQVLDEEQMKSLGMGALLSVSRGSRQPAKLIIMQYSGGKPKSKPIVLVGKGLTFDAGGISLKPPAAMDEMKYDMCGGASVIGAMAACIEMQLPINLISIVPASENLPDGNANKPGDIVTSMSGQTIEVLNTDAEGRLILCDALTYAERFNPAVVIDVATLTGACVIALGAHATGLLSNDDALAEELLNAGERANDRAWRLPIWDDYQSQLDSNFADMANIGGKGAGAITAACFLSRYTGKYKWAHMDIAGTAWKTGKEKGATGRPVPLLVEFLLNRCKF